MLRSMIIRDLKSRYVGSLMGIFWSVIHPLTQIVLYYFIFAVVFKIRLGPEYGGTNFYEYGDAPNIILDLYNSNIETYKKMFNEWEDILSSVVTKGS